MYVIPLPKDLSKTMQYSRQLTSLSRSTSSWWYFFAALSKSLIFSCKQGPWGVEWPNGSLGAQWISCSCISWCSVAASFIWGFSSHLHKIVKRYWDTYTGSWQQHQVSTIGKIYPLAQILELSPKSLLHNSHLRPCNSSSMVLMVSYIHAWVLDYKPSGPHGNQWEGGSSQGP